MQEGWEELAEEQEPKADMGPPHCSPARHRRGPERRGGENGAEGEEEEEEKAERERRGRERKRGRGSSERVRKQSSWQTLNQKER